MIFDCFRKQRKEEEKRDIGIKERELLKLKEVTDRNSDLIALKTTLGFMVGATAIFLATGCGSTNKEDPDADGTEQAEEDQNAEDRASENPVGDENATEDVADLVGDERDANTEGDAEEEDAQTEPDAEVIPDGDATESEEEDATTEGDAEDEVPADAVEDVPPSDGEVDLSDAPEVTEEDAEEDVPEEETILSCPEAVAPPSPPGLETILAKTTRDPSLSAVDSSGLYSSNLDVDQTLSMVAPAGLRQCQIASAGGFVSKLVGDSANIQGTTVTTGGNTLSSNDKAPSDEKPVCSPIAEPTSPIFAWNVGLDIANPTSTKNSIYVYRDVSMVPSISQYSIDNMPGYYIDVDGTIYPGMSYSIASIVAGVTRVLFGRDATSGILSVTTFDGRGTIETRPYNLPTSAATSNTLHIIGYLPGENASQDLNTPDRINRNNALCIRARDVAEPHTVRWTTTVSVPLSVICATNDTLCGCIGEPSNIRASYVSHYLTGGPANSAIAIDSVSMNVPVLTGPGDNPTIVLAIRYTGGTSPFQQFVVWVNVNVTVDFSMPAATREKTVLIKAGIEYEQIDWSEYCPPTLEYYG